MVTHSSTLAWKIPWTEEPGRLQSMLSLRVRPNRETSLSLFTFTHWRRKWQPTPLFLPGESQGWRSLVGCRLRGRTESDTTEATQQQQQQQQVLQWGNSSSFSVMQQGVKLQKQSLRPSQAHLPVCTECFRCCCAVIVLVVQVLYSPTAPHQAQPLQTLAILQICHTLIYSFCTSCSFCLECSFLSHLSSELSFFIFNLFHSPRLT